MNVATRTIFEGDNLDVMRGMDRKSIDLIYLDPPFNSNRNYSAPIGSEAAGAAFKDMWTLDDVKEAEHGELADRDPALYSVIQAARETHGKGMQSYLIMMALRLLEMKRILKNTGSIYLHCDPTASHYLKLLMDSVFGVNNFRNEIIWHYGKWSNVSKFFQRNHDNILFYSLSDAYTFNKQFHISPDKKKKLEVGYAVNRPKGVKQLLVYDRGKAAKKIEQGDYDTIVYRDEQNPGSVMHDTWNDINILNSQAKERIGYPTQKPIALLERIIKASSNEGDMVLDPFCGCATTCVAAEKLGRQWIGIDLSPMAVKLVKERLAREVLLGDDSFDIFGEVIHRTDFPIRIKAEEEQEEQETPEHTDYRQHKWTLYGRQEGLCNGCKEWFRFGNLAVDHIIPRSKDGGDEIENRQLLCMHCNSMHCNSRKGRKSMEYLREVVNSERRQMEAFYYKHHRQAETKLTEENSNDNGGTY